LFWKPFISWNGLPDPDEDDIIYIKIRGKDVPLANILGTDFKAYLSEDNLLKDDDDYSDNPDVLAVDWDDVYVFYVVRNNFPPLTP
jgi:hypothetical protein